MLFRSLSYLVSVVDASRLHEIEMGNEEKERVMRWDEARFSATLSVRP